MPRSSRWAREPAAEGSLGRAREASSCRLPGRKRRGRPGGSPSVLQSGTGASRAAGAQGRSRRSSRGSPTHRRRRIAEGFCLLACGRRISPPPRPRPPGRIGRIGRIGESGARGGRRRRRHVLDRASSGTFDVSESARVVDGRERARRTAIGPLTRKRRPGEDAARLRRRSRLDFHATTGCAQGP